MDKQTVSEQKVWEHYKGVEEDNYQLRRKLDKVMKENKSLRHHNRIMRKKLNKGQLKNEK